MLMLLPTMLYRCILMTLLNVILKRFYDDVKLIDGVISKKKTIKLFKLKVLFELYVSQSVHQNHID